MRRKLVLMLLAMVMALMLIACGNGNGNDDANDFDTENGDAAYEALPVMTMEEVEANDGQDGADAYVVVDGIVYDVTDSPQWTDGSHQGHQAGQDLTEELLEDSPHGEGVMDDFEPIGRIE